MSLRFHINAIDAILGNVCGTQGQNYVELLQGSGMTAGYLSLQDLDSVYIKSMLDVLQPCNC